MVLTLTHTLNSYFVHVHVTPDEKSLKKYRDLVKLKYFIVLYICCKYKIKLRVDILKIAIY